MKNKITTDKAPVPAGPYSQAIVSGNRVYVSGQGPLDPATGKIAGTTTAEHTRQVLTNIKYILEAAGSSMGDVVKVSAFLTDMKNFSEFNEVYKEFFTEPTPVRTTVGVQMVDILVEIDVIAEK